MSFAIAVAFLAGVSSIVAALPGIIVVLQRQAMITDAISHAVLPGIVIAAMIIGAVDSPLLLVGATIAGIIVVAGTQWLRDTGLLAGDAATGLVFPPLFAIGVILLSANFRTSHLSEHTVLVGDLNITAFNRLIIGGYDLGPSYAYTLIVVGLISGGLMFLLRRPLSAAIFDPDFARLTGIPVAMLNQVVMVLVSLTVVAAFRVAGSILIVALMIVPAATAMLFAKTVRQMVVLALVIALAGSQIGFWTAYLFNGPTSAVMAFVDGVIFVVLFVALRIYTRTKRGKTAA
ncbi:metal ABC transporter permease [Corynebacterium sp. TAE3-ERU12]|uniref:metal ABC transporter permease n=1 Tax=Corynebacterium sp. TAE3-ERU12 TaxID=2849491 RepID=UPI001C47BDED|nr:metal ABC transporter permease [Corynebacterium sp. TAE3-ERU12]MBV7295920.1 metal ABC transporter permease [Corynebacterium sp. TAE3-ERU12]